MRILLVAILTASVLLIEAASAAPVFTTITAFPANRREHLTAAVIVDTTTNQIVGGSGAWFVFDAPMVGYHFFEDSDEHWLEGVVDTQNRTFDIRGVWLVERTKPE